VMQTIKHLISVLTVSMVFILMSLSPACASTDGAAIMDLDGRFAVAKASLEKDPDNRRAAKKALMVAWGRKQKKSYNDKINDGYKARKRYEKIKDKARDKYGKAKRWAGDKKKDFKTWKRGWDMGKRRR